jgi:tetratricopeptide (TPR) repeat protein
MGMTARAAVGALAALISGVGAGQSAETFSGSGVVIGTDGEILTNAHVVEACEKITVKLASGNSETGVLLARDERNDLAVVRPTGTSNPAASVAVFRERPPVRAGDAIVALGYPLSRVLATEAKVSVGNVTALAGIADDSSYLQISAPIQPGNSGGPLLDASGHLVGIVTAGLDAVRMAKLVGDIPQNVNFALKAEVARTFLDSKRIGYQTARSDQQLSPADVGDIGRPFTVHIECEQAGSRSAAAPPIVSPPPPNSIEPTSQQIGWCRGSGEPSADLIIDGCTAVIKSDRQAWAFVGRGWGHHRNGDYDRAIADYTEAIRLDPGLALAYNNRGFAYSAKGDNDRAIADYDQAIKINPLPASNPHVNVYVNRGNAYLAKGDFDRAIADSNEAIRLDPKLANAYGNRGIAYYRKGDYDRAIADYTETIRLDPKLATAFNYRASAYEYKGEYHRAIADSNEAIRLDPKLATAYSVRASAYNSKGDYDRAIADSNEAIRLDPKLAAAYQSRGVTYRAEGDFDRAIADSNEAIRLDPKLAAAYVDRGLAYAAKGDLKRAIADYNDAITLDPKSAFAHNVRGIANLYAGAIPKALTDLDQASRLDSKNSYTAIWFDIVNKRSNLPSRLAQAMTQIDSTKWPAPVIRLYLGQLTPGAVLAAADDRSPNTKKGHVCEANFYSAQLALQQGAKAEAWRLFQLAAADCPKEFVEWPAANAELRALSENH